MSKVPKERRAEQAKKRRAKKKKELVILRRKALNAGASVDIRNAYKAALQKRNNVLEYDKKRAAVRRAKFNSKTAKPKSSAQQDVLSQHEAQGIYRLKKDRLKKMREYQSSKRSKKKFDFIKSMIEKEQRDINKPWVPYKRTLLTPLGAAVKACDLAAVRWLIGKKSFNLANMWRSFRATIV